LEPRVIWGLRQNNATDIASNQPFCPEPLNHYQVRIGDLNGGQTRKRKELISTAKKNKKIGIFKREEKLSTERKKFENTQKINTDNKVFESTNKKSSNYLNFLTEKVIKKLDGYSTDKKNKSQVDKTNKTVYSQNNCKTKFLDLKPKPKILFSNQDNEDNRKNSISHSIISISNNLENTTSIGNKKPKYEMQTAETRKSFSFPISLEKSENDLIQRKERRLYISKLDKSFILFEGKLFVLLNVFLK
jgi:hypothetical protein